MLVVHSNPVVEPRVGDAGGMTVYVRQMARALAARALDVAFHTLGRVKNEGRTSGEPVEPDCRLRGEARVIAEANAIVASAPDEREWLIDLYAAHPERIHVIPPGVDHATFRPGDREAAKADLGLSGKQVLLFVGRLQPLKGADTAIEALEHLIAWG